MKYYHFFLILSLLTFGACKKDEATAENKDSKETETAAVAPEESPLVTLTNEQIQTAGIKTGEMEMKELSTEVRATGMITVLNQSKAVITSAFGGTLQNITVHQGDMVQKGQVIATLMNPSFINTQEEYLTIKAQLSAGSDENVAAVSNSQYATLQEQYNTIQPQIALAEKEVKRQKELNAGNAGSLKNLQQAETELSMLTTKSNILLSQMSLFSKNTSTMLQTRRSILESKLRLLDIDPNTLTTQNLKTTLAIKSPISGRVGEITAKIGAYITENTGITDIINLNDLHVDLNVYEADIDKFYKQQVLKFTTINNPTQTYTAVVHNLGAMLNPETKTIEVHAHIEGDKTGLIEGMNVMAAINTGRKSVKTLPNDAIVTEGGKNYIFVLQQSNAKETIFTKTPIQKGVTEGSYTQVTPLETLPDNAKIIINQAFFVLGKMNNTGEE